MTQPQTVVMAHSRRTNPFEALRIPAFRLVFADGVLTSVGMSASTLVQGWLVLSLSNDSPLWVGVSVAFNGVGRLVFAIVGGVISDRLDRRMILFCAQLTAAFVAAVLALTCY